MTIIHGFIIFVITILAVRTLLLIKPMSGPTIKKVRIHHYVYGLILILLGIASYQIWLYAIGLGLFADEITFLIATREPFSDKKFNEKLYRKKGHAFGLILIVFVTYLLKDQIFFF